MLAMQWQGPGQALRQVRLPIPVCGAEEVLLRVLACGVCRTDLHIVDAELPPHRLPVVPGHEIVGELVQAGAHVERFKVGQRVGVPWLGGTCGHCPYCSAARENLCDQPVFTGYDRDGGYAQYALADARYCLAIPDRYDAAHAAPLLCAGLIGYRAYVMAGAGRRLGLYGFGAAAHLLAQVALAHGREVYAFTRPGDLRTQRFALSLGVAWAGDSDTDAPVPLDAAIIFAPHGALVPAALAACAKGGTVVCAGIHMSDIPAFPYALLWQERCLRSVANLTRADGAAFLAVAARLPLRTVVTTFPLLEANRALAALRDGAIDGAAVLMPVL
ncbi:zinc-dependent alcohol dehydrogenase family protein [Janthinobacterium sp. JC611]|uniref:zinc-dependent alcohol dehydrogenase family protein n=1 Tax=Janthinobacterium sp. JC611 TaxID=2816201 RepID=UPI001BFDAB11|nr:zinc-dependent alcohol dehydrogenase family protein [Janthinobacterium sp. JC611]